MLGGEKLGIRDTRHGLLRLQLLGQHTGHQVDTLVVQNRQEKIAVTHIGICQHLWRHGGTDNSEQVVLRLQPFQQLGIGVHHRDIMVQICQRLSQIEAHLAVACNDDIHSLLFKFAAAKIQKNNHIQ